MKRALLALLFAACVKPVPDAGAPLVAAAAVDAGTLFTAASEQQACQSCHSSMIIDQQRLAPGQWTAVVKKMKTFGAALDDAQVEPLAAKLAERRGTNATLPDVRRIDAKLAAELFAPQDDGALAGGDSAQGKALFEARCVSCHGADAHGGIGVNLADRSMLDRAADFATSIRVGRGLMPPQADLSDAQLGQVLAYLRSK